MDKRNRLKIGDKFTRLTVTGHEANKGYICQCDCGNKSIIRSSTRLLKGSTRSCGCLAKELLSRRRKSHGFSKEKIYKVWNTLVHRCTDPSNRNAKNYVLRGINVCERWKTFTNFREDMKPSYDAHVAEHGVKQTSIDRIDNNGDYSPENCRWATRVEQALNTRVTTKVMYKGELRKLVEVGRENGIDLHCVYGRLNIGWDPERALTTPVDHEWSITKFKNNSKNNE